MKSENKCNKLIELSVEAGIHDLVSERINTSYENFCTANWHDYGTGVTPEYILHTDALEYAYTQAKELYDNISGEIEFSQPFDYHVGKQIWVNE